MPGKKKKFIDKKQSVSFHLAHRSQRDPLQADDDAPKHVLLPMGQATEDQAQSRKEEQKKYGVLFDDDYDYLQHLKDVDELNDVGPVESFRLQEQPRESKNEPTLNLPSSVFASELETDVGMLNKAAPISGPRLDWDPDIVAAMDEDFDFENPNNELDDDFVIKANDGELLEGEMSMTRLERDDDHMEIYKPYRPKIEVHSGDSDDEVPSDEADMSDNEGYDGFDDRSMGEQSFEDMDTKSRFTSYSMSSSVIRRSAGLSLLDDRFEKLYEQYDDVEIGALDHEDINGFLNPDSQLLNAAMEDFEKQQQIKKLEDSAGNEKEICEYASDSEDDDADLVKMTVREPKEKWDCESILSTHSTLYNHPKLITEPKKCKPIKLTKRVAIPDDVLPTRGLTHKQIERSMHEDRNIDRVDTHRPKGETAEEKRVRKKAVKEERMNRRIEKKINKEAFKDEKIKQNKEHLNIQQNMRGLTIT